MGKLHSQLALYGSIDDEVVRRDDPRTTEIVERFLPGTTGYGQRGWYRELRTFIDKLAPSGSVQFPTREEALRDLARPRERRLPTISAAHLPRSGSDDAFELKPPEDDADETNPIWRGDQAFVREMSRKEFEEFLAGGNDLGPRPDPSPTPDTLTWSTLARATYAAAVIAKVEGPRSAPPAPAPIRPLYLRWRGGGIIRIRDPGERVDDDPLTTLLEMAAPHPFRRGMNIDVLPSGPPVRDVISDSRLLDRGRPGWRPFMERMARHNSIAPSVANYPAPCVGTLRKVGGEFCTVVTTEVFSEKVQLDDLKPIVDPQNWHQDLPSFFCAMEPRDDDPAGWNQILECVSTECNEYRLKTALKYWNDTRGDYGIYINYDLADDRSGDTGLVEVDSGYIWITKALHGGVRIKTSKALKICGLSPTATAALACFSGWAQVGIDMLVNAALRPHQGAIDFDPSTLPNARASQLQNKPADAEPADPPVAGARLPDLPPGFRRDLVEDTAEQLNHYIDATARLTQNFARRWQNGLTREDLQQFGESVGKEMTDLAVGTFDSVMGSFRPKSTPPPRTTPAIRVSTETARPDLVDRLADAAQQGVDDTKSEAEAAADKIDDGAYNAVEMADTASRLAGIAIKGWIDLAAIALNQPGTGSAAARTSEPAPRPRERKPVPAAEPVRFAGNGLGATLRVMSELANRAFLNNLDVVKGLVDQRVPDVASVVTDHMTTVVRRMANQARTVVDDAAKQLDGQGYGPDDWAKTMTKLSDVALINGIELAGTALVGPGRYETEPITSDFFLVQLADPHQQHALSLTSPLVLAGGHATISEDCVTFDPADGVLPAGTNIFRIRVEAAGLRSGIYLGAVWAIPRDASGSQAVSEAISEEVVPVIIGL